MPAFATCRETGSQRGIVVGVRISWAFTVAALLLLAAGSALGVELDSLLIGGSEVLTVNRYNRPWADDLLRALTPEDDTEVRITGSEGVPLDVWVSGGARLLMAELREGQFTVTFEPTLGLSVREYLLYPSGRVVPTQSETGLGDEMGEPGRGVRRVLTAAVGVPWYIGYQIVPRYGVALGLSLTTLWRIPVGTLTGDPAGLVGYFYREARFFMPEVQLVNRIEVTEALGFDVRTTVGFPVFHLWDGNQLPFWDQARFGLGIDLRLKLPLSQYLPPKDEDSDAQATQSPADQPPDDAVPSDQSTP